MKKLFLLLLFPCLVQAGGINYEQGFQKSPPSFAVSQRCWDKVQDIKDELDWLYQNNNGSTETEERIFKLEYELEYWNNRCEGM